MSDTRPSYTVRYRTVGSDVERTMTFRTSGLPDGEFDGVAHRRAWSYMRGIDASGGTAGFPQWHGGAR